MQARRAQIAFVGSAVHGIGKDETMSIYRKPVMLVAAAGAALMLMPVIGSVTPMIAGSQGVMAQAATMAETPRQISVSGTGRVELAPDMATVRIGVTHQDEEAGVAMQMTSDAVAAMLGRVEELGIAARDVQTAGLSLNPVWRERPVEPGQSGEMAISGYEASNLVTLRLRNLAQVGDVLGALISDGANRLDGLSFGLQDPQAAADAARRAAVADARRKAELYAGAAGVTLGAVTSLSETGGGGRPMMMEMASMRADSVPVAAGEVGVTAQVQMVFALE